MIKEWEQAIQRGELERIRDLIKEGVDVDSKDSHGQTALMVAARKGHTDVVRFLVQSGAELNVAAKYNLTALMLAVINGHTEIVRSILEAGADTQVRGTGAPGFQGKNALELAEEAGRPEITSILKMTD
jgi:ankyrin repeat protein